MKTWILTLLIVLSWLGGRLLSENLLALRTTMDVALVLVAARTAFRFEPGDPPRLAWAAVAAAQTLSTIAHVITDYAFASSALPAVSALTIALNSFWVAAIIIFVINLRSSGLAPEWTLRSSFAVGSLALAAAVGLGFVLYTEFGDLQAAQNVGEAAKTIANVASTCADALVFVGAVFLIRMVAPMALGRVAQPYLLICASAAAYLVLDVLKALAGADDYAPLNVGAQVWIALADGAVFAAALAQVRVLRDQH